jgi:hypothetical protein
MWFAALMIWQSVQFGTLRMASSSDIPNEAEEGAQQQTPNPHVQVEHPAGGDAQ